MSSVDYSLEVYAAVESIAGELVDESDEEMAEQLEEEFGIDFYPLETDPDNKFEKDTANEYMRAGFGISSLLADRYVDPQDTFFQNRSDDFQGFEEELGERGNQFLTDHMMQYVNLYSSIADEEDVEVSHGSTSIALMDKSAKREAVLQVLGELEEGLTDVHQERELVKFPVRIFLVLDLDYFIQ